MRASTESLHGQYAWPVFPDRSCLPAAARVWRVVRLAVPRSCCATSICLNRINKLAPGNLTLSRRPGREAPGSSGSHQANTPSIPSAPNRAGVPWPAIAETHPFLADLAQALWSFKRSNFHIARLRTSGMNLTSRGHGQQPPWNLGSFESIWAGL